MRTLRWLLLLSLSSLASAQFTTVTGTVVDPNNVPYASGTISAVLNTSASPTLSGLPYQPPTQPAGLNATGKFVMQLADNTVLLPGGTTWTFTVCSAAGSVQPAGGRGPVCFTVSALVIAGASQDISVQLQAAALALVLSGPSCSGTGIVRNVGPCAELSGAVSTSGSNATTIATNLALPGSPTTTTQTQGDNSTKIATTAYVDADLSPVGIAGFISSRDILGVNGGGSSAGWSTITGYFVAFYLPKAITITKVTVNISAVSASANKQLGVAIYPAVAGSLVLASATFNVSAGQATGARTASIAQTSVRLPVGWYFGVSTVNAGDVGYVYESGITNAAMYAIWNSNGNKRLGTVTVSVPGTPDNTLGTLTASTAVSGGISAFWEP
jgi:hypothetical protein